MNDRRRPGLPGELVARVGMIWSGVALLQIAAALIAGSSAGTGPGHMLAAAALACTTLLGIFLLIGRIAYRVFDEEVAGLACLAAAMALPLMAAVRPGVGEFQALQVLAGLAALNGLMARDARQGGWTVGLAAAAWLAVSANGMVLAAAFAVVGALKWLRNPAERWWLVHMLQAATVGIAAAVAGRWTLTAAQPCGGLTVADAAGLGGATALVTLLAALGPHPRGFILAGFGLALGTAAGIAAVLNSSCGFAGLAAPLWHGGPLFVIQSLGVPVLGMIAALRLAAPARDWLRRWWDDYALLIAASIVAATLDSRIAPLACAFAAVPLGWQLREWTRAARNARRQSRRALALAGVAVAVAPALPLSLLVVATPSEAVQLAER